MHPARWDGIIQWRSLLLRTSVGTGYGCHLHARRQPRKTPACGNQDVYSSVSKGGYSGSSRMRGVFRGGKKKEREREAHYLSCPPRLPLAAQIAQNFILEFPFYCSMTMTRGSHFLFQDQTCMLFHWALGNSYTCKMLLNVCAGWLLCTPRGWGAI